MLRTRVPWYDEYHVWGHPEQGWAPAIGVEGCPTKGKLYGPPMPGMKRLRVLCVCAVYVHYVQCDAPGHMACIYKATRMFAIAE